MLFLYRPRQTWMPYRRPRPQMQQDAYNRNLQETYDATRRAAPPTPTPIEPQRDTIGALKELAQLRESGALTEEEFAAAKRRLLAADDAA